MELNDIKMFYEVAQTNSVSQAAQNLGYTQSNISKRIKRLEEELDQRLFERNNKGMQLTETGLQFLHYAKQLLSVYIEIESVFITSPTTLKIGTTQTIAHNYLRAYFLKPEYTIFIDSTKILLQQLYAGAVDFLILNQHLTNQTVTIQQTVCEQICLVQAKTSEKAEMFTTLLINRDPKRPYRLETLALLEHYELSSIQLIEVDTLDMMMAMLEYSGMCAVLPKKIIETHSNLSMWGNWQKESSVFVYTLQNKPLSHPLILDSMV